MTTDVAGPLTAAVDALDAQGIRWAVLRGELAAPDAGDIDVLVHPADVPRLEAMLEPAGFARIVTWRHGDHRFYIAYDEAADRWVKLDTVDRFAYRSGRELPVWTVEAALRDRGRADGYWRVSPADEFWALFLHTVLDRGAIGAAHLERLRALADPEPRGPLRDALDHEPLAAAAVAGARAGDEAGLLSLRGSLQTVLARPPVTRRLWRGVLSASSPALKAICRPGVSIVVLGPDGAGKSTLVASLPGRLPLPVRTYYVGLYGARLRALRETGIPGVALASQLAAAWAAYVSAAYQRRRGHITVFDRYGYDALLDGRPTSRNAKRSLRRALIGSLAPRPDLVLVLDAPATRLHRRKSEHGITAIEARRTGYQRLAQRLGPRVTTELIDASASRPSVRRRATALIWRAFADRRSSRRRTFERQRYNRVSIEGDPGGAHGDR